MFAGEDPFLASRYGVEYTKGMQQGDVRTRIDDDSEGSSVEDSASTEGWLQAAAGCKHLLAYDLERSNGTDRFHFDIQF